MRISDWSSDVCSSDLGPSVPVEVLGLSGVPSAGDIFTVVENDARAREVAAYRQSVLDKKRTATAPVNLENMFAAKGDQPVEFPLVVKADVQGSVEAIVNAVNRISNEDIKVRVRSEEHTSDLQSLMRISYA